MRDRTWQRGVVLLGVLAVVLSCGTVLAGGGEPPAVSAPGEESKPPPGVSQDWWASVQADIRRSEYEIIWQASADGGGAYQAPNRAQGLRSVFSTDGVRVVPRTVEDEAWELSLRVAGFGDGILGDAAVVEWAYGP